MSLVSANSLDLETKISQLEKINFDLKMRIFHLNDQLSGTSKVNPVADNGIAEKVVDLLRERDITVIQTKEAHDIALRRIAELESELAQLKITRGVDNSFTSTKSFISSSVELVESLRRERETANAIAEHDASLIMSLEQEVLSLRNQHESNTKLISEYAQREQELKESLQQKRFEIEQTNQQLHMARQLLESMEEKMRQQMPSGLKPFHLQAGDKSPLKGRNGQHISTYSNSYNTASPSRADRYTSDTSHIVDDIRSSFHRPETMTPNVYSRNVSFHQTQQGLSSSMLTSMSNYDEPIPDVSNPLVHQALAGELLNLRRENGLLRAQLERDRESMIAQEHAMATARNAAEELTMLEAEEIARLEGDLERSNRERDRWQAMYKKSEAISETLRQEVFALERREEVRELEKYQLMQVQDLVTYASGKQSEQCLRRNSPTGKNRTTSGSRARTTGDRDRDRTGSENLFGRSGRRRKGEDIWDPGSGNAYGTYPFNENIHCSPSISPKRPNQDVYNYSHQQLRSSGSSSNAVKSPLPPDSSHRGHYVEPTSNTATTSVGKRDAGSAPAATDDNVVKMYRQREEELLEALEGVVRRCRTLETKLGL